MMKYICQKPSTFGDKRYVIGEEIPAELIDPSRVKTLLRYGTIAAVETSTPPAGADTLPPAENESEKNESEKSEDTEGDQEQQKDEAPGNPAVETSTPPKKGSGKKADQK